MVSKVLVFCFAGLLSIGAAAQQHKVENIVQGGLGGISYELTKENYYIDWDPGDPMSGKRKYKPWDIGLMTGLTFSKGPHWQFGAEVNIGLRNLLIQYPTQPIVNRHFHTLMFTCGYRF